MNFSTPPLPPKHGARVVATSWRAEDLEFEEATSRADRVWVGVLLAAFILANVAVIWSALAAPSG